MREGKIKEWGKESEGAVRKGIITKRKKPKHLSEKSVANNPIKQGEREVRAAKERKKGRKERKRRKAKCRWSPEVVSG